MNSNGREKLGVVRKGYHHKYVEEEGNFIFPWCILKCAFIEFLPFHGNFLFYLLSLQIFQNGDFWALTRINLKRKVILTWILAEIFFIMFSMLWHFDFPIISRWIVLIAPKLDFMMIKWFNWIQMAGKSLVL